MNTPPVRSWFPTFASIGSKLRSRRFWRVVFFLAVIAATVVGLIYTEENWRGRRAWNTYRRDALKRGESLDLRAFVPTAVPSEQNFAAIPAVKEWFQRPQPKLENDLIDRADFLLELPKESRATRQMTDFVALREALAAVAANTNGIRITKKARPLAEQETAAAAVLSTIVSTMPELDQFRAAAQRPKSVYPIEYLMEEPYAILLPHLARIRHLTQRLALRASAEIAAGKTDDALADTLLVLRITESLRDEPFLISQLVRLACFNIAAQPIWEGMVMHRWNAAQLSAIEARLSELSVLPMLPTTFRLERAAGLATLDTAARRPEVWRGLYNVPGDESPTIASMWWRLTPSGWYAFEKVTFAGLIDRNLAVATKQSFDPRKVRAVDKEIMTEVDHGDVLSRVLEHRVAAGLLLPALGKAAIRFASGEVVLEQARTACALERFRIGRGAYPKSLEELVPTHLHVLPRDLLSEGPLKYRGGGNSYVLYSVGANGTDEGGQPGTTIFDRSKGDLLWTCEPLQ